MPSIRFHRRSEYTPGDFDVLANNRTISEESSDPVEVHLPNENCIVIYPTGEMEYWSEGGRKLQFKGQFIANGLTVGN